MTPYEKQALILLSFIASQLSVLVTQVPMSDAVKSVNADTCVDLIQQTKSMVEA